MKSLLEKSLKKKWVIRFITKHPDSDGYSGIVLHYSRSLIAIKEYDDFKPDGLIFFPRRAIEKIRDDGFEECENKILRMTGDIKAAKKTNWISKVNNLNQLFSYCHKNNIWPAVETIRNDEEAFYLGPITKVNSSSIWQYCYDGAGEWEDEYNIKNKDVLRVEIFSHYVDSFNNYMMAYNKQDSVGHKKPANF
jgi:hypothetical protein